jgi:ribosomal protein S4
VRHREAPVRARQHGKRRSKVQGYGIQLREKQKVKRIYGVLEKQFRRYFQKAERSKGITGEILLQTLERRLDNVVYRLGFAPSRPMARQLVAHGHFTVNGKNVHVPSYLVKAGDAVSLKDRTRKNDAIKASLATASAAGFRRGSRRRPRSSAAPCRAAVARRHPAPDQRAADRRALLEVSTKRSRRSERAGGFRTMLWKGFQKPKRLECDPADLTPTYGRFTAQPFERASERRSATRCAACCSRPSTGRP